MSEKSEEIKKQVESVEEEIERPMSQETIDAQNITIDNTQTETENDYLEDDYSEYYHQLRKEINDIVNNTNIENPKKIEQLQALSTTVVKANLNTGEFNQLEKFIKENIKNLDPQAGFKRRAAKRYKQVASRSPEFYAINEERLFDVKMKNGTVKKFMVPKNDLNFLKIYQAALQNSENTELRKSLETTPILEQVTLDDTTLMLPEGTYITFDENYNIYICGQVLGEGSYGKVFIGQSISTGEICAIKMQDLQSEEALENTKPETQYHQEHGNLLGIRHFKADGGITHITIQKLQIGESHFEEKESEDNKLEVFTYQEFEDNNADLLNNPNSTLFDKTDYFRLRLKAFISLTKELQVVQQEGKIHRDLKEANVLIDETGNSRIVDFGTVIEKGKEDYVIGSPGYMPLSLMDKYKSLQMHTYTGQEDVYSLGVMLENLYKSFKKYSDILPDSIHQEFDEIIDAMLSFDDNLEAVPSLDKVLDFLRKVDDYILLKKPLDLSLATPKEVKSYLEAYDTLVKTHPELQPLTVNIGGGNLFTDKEATKLCHEWSDDLNQDEQKKYKEYLKIIANLSNSNKAYIEKYDQGKKEKVTSKPFLQGYTLFANTELKYKNAKALEKALEKLWKAPAPKTPHELAIYGKKVENLIKAAKENEAKALGLLSNRLQKGDVEKMLKEAEKKLPRI